MTFPVCPVCKDMHLAHVPCRRGAVHKVVVHRPPLVVHKELVVVHKPAAGKHGRYADADKRREYRRQWMAKRRAEG